jgi:hypothetical protein
VTYEFRNALDFVFGTLTSAAAVSDTSLASADFASLSSGYNTGNYLPLVLLSPATHQHEKCWVTAHGSGATTATVVRGRESTSAQSWPSGTQWIVAPTLRDVMVPTNSTALPADPHVGMRGLMIDKSEVRQYTRYGGYQADVGVAIPSQIGKVRAGTAIPDGQAMIMRSGYATGTTDAAGQFTVTFSTPFPTACQVVQIGQGASFVNPVIVTSETASTFVAKAWRYSALNIAAAEPAGTSVPITYMAIGY